MQITELKNTLTEINTLWMGSLCSGDDQGQSQETWEKNNRIEPIWATDMIDHDRPNTYEHIKINLLQPKDKEKPEKPPRKPTCYLQRNPFCMAVDFSPNTVEAT